MVMHLGQRTGQKAEDAAAQMLRRQGLKIIERNFRCRMGEIDIIALSNSHLVFIEVRHRKTAAFGSGAESVSSRKQQRIVLAARFFLGTGRYTEYPCRFDVVESRPAGGDELELNWIQNAFQL